MTATPRAELVEEAHLLRAHGLPLRSIAGYMGVAISTAHEYLADPHLERAKARKRALARSCADCGATIGYDAQRCPACANAHSRRWTVDAILAAIQAWAEEHGEPPTVTEWSTADPAHPSVAIVRRRFNDRWSDAIVAAGFARPTRGRRRRHPEPPREDQPA